MHCGPVPVMSLEGNNLRSIPVKPSGRQTEEFFNVSARNCELGGVSDDRAGFKTACLVVQMIN